MTDAHCHVARGQGRFFICDPAPAEGGEGDVRFIGFHPWEFLAGETLDGARLEALQARLVANPRLGVGEIGLDRLRVREIPAGMRSAFEAQLGVAAELGRPVVLHGAKCWGQVVRACAPYRGRLPALVFHGFSRSGGLLPELLALGGYVTVTPAILNDHAVNYRELVKKLPLARLLVESDCTPDTPEGAPGAREVAARLAALLGIPLAELEAQLEANADRVRPR